RRALAAAALVGASTLSRPAGTQPPQTAGGRPGAIAEVTLDEAIQRLAANVQRWGGTVGVHVVDVGTGRTIATLDADKAFNPASNAKLATAAAALRILGAQHRFLTGLYGRIDTDSIDELVLRGDGDPSLRTPALWAMAFELRGAGVRRVRSLAVDQSLFDDRYIPPAFEQQPGEWAPFRAPVAA